MTVADISSLVALASLRLRQQLGIPAGRCTHCRDWAEVSVSWPEEPLLGARTCSACGFCPIDVRVVFEDVLPPSHTPLIDDI